MYVALGADWLADAPGMTPELRARGAERLTGWLNWYQKSGYLRDHPISNYFCGYLTAATFAALTYAGERPEADAWLALAKNELLASSCCPTYARDLAGGDWPEGWQYGELSLAEVALVARAFQTAYDTPVAQQLPWARANDRAAHARARAGLARDL